MKIAFFYLGTKLFVMPSFIQAQTKSAFAEICGKKNQY